jgi:NADPH2:quinone reductase
MAYQMVHRMARVAKTDRVLVHGAAGGIGHLMVQLCRLAGATVYGTGSAGKQETIKSLGALAIDYEREEVEERVKELTGGKGMDVVFDGIGPKPHWEHSFKLVQMFGRLVLFGMMGGMPGGVPDRDVFKDLHENPKAWTTTDLGNSNISIAFYSFATMKINRPDWFRQDLAAMLRLAARGKIKPIIGARFKLSDVRQAHELLDRAAVPGKIILDMRE